MQRGSDAVCEDLYQGIASAMPQHRKIRAALAVEGFAVLAAAKAGHLLVLRHV
jgi:hypothetical protein